MSENDNICSLCCSNETNYQIDCGCSCCVDCIVTWFRAGHYTCPFCRSNGNNTILNRQYSSNRGPLSLFRGRNNLHLNQRIKYLRYNYKKLDKFKHNKNLANKFKKLALWESKLKKTNKEMSTLKKSRNCVYMDIKKKLGSCMRRRWVCISKINNIKLDIYDSFPIIPIIIPHSEKEPKENIITNFTTNGDMLSSENNNNNNDDPIVIMLSSDFSRTTL